MVSSQTLFVTPSVVMPPTGTGVDWSLRYCPFAADRRGKAFKLSKMAVSVEAFAAVVPMNSDIRRFVTANGAATEANTVQDELSAEYS